MFREEDQSTSPAEDNVRKAMEQNQARQLQRMQSVKFGPEEVVDAEGYCRTLTKFIAWFLKEHRGVIITGLFFGFFGFFFYIIPPLRLAMYPRPDNPVVFKYLLFIAAVAGIYLVACIIQEILLGLANGLLILCRSKSWIAVFTLTFFQGQIAPILSMIFLISTGKTWGPIAFDNKGATTDLVYGIFITLLVIAIAYLARTFLSFYIFWRVNAQQFVERVERVNANEAMLETLCHHMEIVTAEDEEHGGKEPSRFSRQSSRMTHGSLKQKQEENSRIFLHKMEKLKMATAIGPTTAGQGSGFGKNPLDHSLFANIKGHRKASQFSKELWEHLNWNDADTLRLDDFKRMFDDEEAEATFLKFAQGTSNDSVSLQDMTPPYQFNYDTFHDSVIRMRDKWMALTSDMQSSDSASSALIGIVSATFWVAIPFIIAATSGVELNTIVLTSSTILLSLSFALGSSISRLVESMYFLFVTEPYKVGDRIAVGNPSFSKDIFIVTEINLMTTTAKTIDNKLVFLPNYALAADKVTNMNRLENAVLNIIFEIGYQTTPEQLAMLEQQIRKFLLRNNVHWKPSSLMFFNDGLQSLNKIVLSMWIVTRYKWQDGPVLAGIRSQYLNFCQQQMTKLGITYNQPRLDVNLAGSKQE